MNSYQASLFLRRLRVLENMSVNWDTFNSKTISKGVRETALQMWYKQQDVLRDIQRKQNESNR